MHFKIAAISVTVLIGISVQGNGTSRAADPSSGPTVSARKTRVQLTCEQIQKNGQNETLENTLPLYSEHFYIVAKFNSCLNTLLTPPYTYLRTSGTGSGLVSRNKEGTQVVLAQFPASGTLSSFGLTPSLIKSIAIPNDIQAWPTTALNGCTNLETITVFGEPAKEATIELSVDHGLQNLGNLKFLRLPSTIGAMGKDIDDGSGCHFPGSLQSVDLQECSFLRSIGAYAFSHCTSLTSLNLSGCSPLQSIGRYAFYNCNMLPFFDLPNCPSLQKIGYAAFCYCRRLIFLDFSRCPLLHTIDSNAFRVCSGLATLFPPERSVIQSVGEDAFAECYSLTTVMLSRLPASSGLSSFKLTPGIITELWIPSNLASWPTDALNGCTNLQTIMTYGPNGQAAKFDLLATHGLQQLTQLVSIRLPSTLKIAGDGITVNDGTANVFPTSLQSVNFQDCSFLQSIGNNAFYGCSLKALDLSSCTSLQSIGDSAFNICRTIAALNLSGCSSLKSIGTKAFYDCNMSTIFNFSKCSALQNIGYAAFHNCGRLTSLDFSTCSSLTELAPNAFSNCSQLQTVIFPASLTTVGAYAFKNTPLATVNWMGSSKAASIGTDAFPSTAVHVLNYKP